MTSLDPSHIPVFSQKKHTQVGAATHDIGGATPHRHTILPRLPDLRFEQSYLLSIKPFVSEAPTSPNSGAENEKEGRRALVKQGVLDDSSGPYGVSIQIDWKGVAWVTVRDQVISPLIQGAVWGTASIFLIPVTQYFKRGVGRSPQAKQASPPKGTSEVGLWRAWVRSFLGGAQTNAALR